MRRGRKSKALLGAERWAVYTWRNVDLSGGSTRFWSGVRHEFWGMRAAYEHCGELVAAEFAEEVAELASEMLSEAIDAGRF